MVRAVIALGSSIAALFVGPALLATGRGGARAAAAVDAFVVVVVVGVVFLHYVPHALVEAGPIVLLGMLLGLCLPYWAEQASRGHNGWVKPLALSAFALHASLDGAAMAGTSVQAGGLAFALALVVHRVAEGLAIQHLTRGAGARATGSALGFIALATVLGYVLGERALSMGESQSFLFVQTLSSGALLHVVVHGHAGSKAGPRTEAMGTLVGLAVMAGLLVLDPELAENAHELSMGETVLALALHIAPALLIATLLTVLIERRLRPRVGQTHAGDGRWDALLMGVVSAPCACESADEDPMTPSRANLVSALAHPAAWVVSAALLGPRFATLRLLAGALCALALPLSRALPPMPAAVPSFRVGFARSLRASMGFLVAGLFMAAWLEPVLPVGTLAQLPASLTIPLAAALGLPFHACAIGVTPLLVVLAHKQLDVGALLALALATGLASVVGFGSARNGRFLRVFVAFCASVGFGFAAHVLFDSAAILDLHAHAGASVNRVELACLALCMLLLLRLLLVRGPRALFAPLWPSTPAQHAHGANAAH